jgi:hypothetical protein
MRANLAFPVRRQTNETFLDGEAQEQESGIVRREQANHLLPQELRQTADNPGTALHLAEGPSNQLGASLADDPHQAEFEGEFWNAPPLDTDADADADVGTEVDAPQVVLYSRRRRIWAIAGFAIVFSAMVLLLLGEAAAWFWKHG